MINDIYRELYRHFHTHEYKLQNSFVYDWECDFFAQSKSGYFIEVEVKVSRGDFFRDFDKPKHRLFQDIRAGKTHHIYHRPTTGDLICRVITGQLDSMYGEDNRWGGRGYNWRTGMRNGKWGYWVNDYGHCTIRHIERPIYAPASYINIEPIESIKCPNQLYYACPEGLIKPEEVPDYAGLIYISHYAKVIKKAPYIHKRKQNLDSVLLRKFYNLWQYKTSLADKLELSNNTNSNNNDQ
jgi:hypothetical protein